MKVCYPTKGSIFNMLFILVAQPVYAHEITASTIYKTIDATGNVSYSETMPLDSILIEEIVIDPVPLERNIEDNKARLDRIRETAEQLTEAREKREAKREEEEKKRLERLALLRAASQPLYERNVYASYPLWRPFKHFPRHHTKHHRKHHFDFPVRKPAMSLHEQLTSSFSHR